MSGQSDLRVQGRRVWLAVYASLGAISEGQPLGWERGTWLSPLSICMDSRRVLTLERGPVGTLYTVGVSGYRYVWHDDPDWRPLCTEGPAPAQRARPLAERQPVRDTDCTIYIEHASEVLVCAGCRRRKTVEAEALSARLGIAPDYERGLAEVSEEDHQLRERLRLDRAHGPARHVPVGRWR